MDNLELFIAKDFLIHVIEQLRQKHLNSSEPIPNYTEQEIDELFNTIKRVYAGYLNNPSEKIATALYNITKNHHLSNGNKRCAVIIAKFLLWVEGKNFDNNDNILELLTLQIANGELTKEQTIKYLNTLLKS